MFISPVILAILDGWGVSRVRRGNAVAEAYKPTIDALGAFHPSLTLQASGFSAGMLWGEPGNSAAGHLTLGAGRIIYNHLPRILKELRSGNFFENEVLKGAAAHVRRTDATLHLVGLVSSASAHSYLDHLYALFDLATRERISKVVLHMITDGRDAAPQHTGRILEALEGRLAEQGFSAAIGTVMGRYFAMDRDENWDRTEKAWRAVVEGAGERIQRPFAYVSEQYLKDVTDEMLPPAVCTDASGSPLPRITDNDAVVFFNFREDGLRQLAQAFADPSFDRFPRRVPQNLYLVTFTAYAAGLPVGVAFPAPAVENTLPELLSRHGVKQLRISESLKYAQVTHFFNAGREEPYRFEDRIIIPSDTVAGPAANPVLKAEEIATEVLRALEHTAHEFILVNFANADALAHTGDYAQTVRAVEAVDRVLGRIYERFMHRRGALLITADHGNAEEMVNVKTGEVKTGHSENPVPFHFVTPWNRFRVMRSDDDVKRRLAQPLGTLADIAPTILDLLHIKRPAEMTGRSLLELL